MSHEKPFPLTEPDGQLMPLAFRWFATHRLLRFKPWCFAYDASPMRNVRRAFRVESGGKRDVIPFAFRQDNDDMAGFEVIDGQVTERVITFHPAWTQQQEDGLLDQEFEDLWTFVSQRVIGDMKDWASEDALPVPSERGHSVTG